LHLIVGFNIGDMHEYVKSEEEYNQVLQQKIDEELQTLKDAGKTGEELKVSPERMKKLQDLIIFNVQNEDGAWMPRLTDEQVRLAKDAVKNEIEFTFGEKRTGTPMQPKVVNNTYRGPGEDKKEKDTDPYKYQKIVKAWRSNDPFALQLYLNESGYSIKKVGEKRYQVVDSFGQVVHTSGSIDDKFMTLFFGNTPNQIAEGQRQLREFYKNNPVTPKKTTTTPKKKTATPKKKTNKIVVPAPG